MPWSMGKCQLTKPFIYQLALWARELSWEQVARLFEVDWSQVKTAVESAVQFGLERRDTDNVTLLGIDEISRRKGHLYLTQVYEITEGNRRLLWSGTGRSKETLRAFFQHWGPEKSKRIIGVCCDMWNPYVDVIKEYAPQATIVFDKFHIVRHLNDAVDQVRRQEADELSKKGDNLLRNTRYIWLKNPENLTALQQIKLHQLAGQSLKTHRAYQIKRAFQAIWDSSDRETAAFAFKQWFRWATHSRLKSMSKLAWSMHNHKEQILAYFILQINNSIVEGLNNKAKVIMRRSFGFHSPEVCKLAL
ncbi:ISL3 family transposase, partial [bacterium]|nr:ISL3 family transposase [bacterium]